jgi:RimJ/RimL family protein N-acetyltransferase
MSDLDIQIRKTAPTDAESLLRFFEQLDTETHFMLFEPGERNQSVEEQEKRLIEIDNNPAIVIFVAEIDRNIIGFAAATGGMANRNRHSAFIAIGILQAFWHKGIGCRLLQSLENWAKENGMHRLDLNVSPHNHRALHLYEKFGFERAGIKRKSLLVDGEYIDEIYMDKVF